MYELCCDYFFFIGLTVKDFHSVKLQLSFDIKRNIISTISHMLFAGMLNVLKIKHTVSQTNPVTYCMHMQ